MVAMKPKISYGPNADATKVTAYSLSVLESILIKAGIPSCMITSTARDAYNQARVMFDNLEVDWAPDGVADKQHELYGNAGDMVIDVYEALKKQKKKRDEIIKAMSAKITEIGAEKVSKHASDPNILNVFDVGPKSLPADKRDDFERAVVADKRVAKFLKPPSDPGYHLEIPQPKKK